MRKLALLALFAAGPALAMIGGDPAPDDDQVAALLGYDTVGGGGGVFCTATLISPTWVLTAGHCVDLLNAQDSTIQIWVYFNDTPYTDGTNAIRVRQAFAHPDWDNGDWEHDIALVELREERDAEPVILDDLSFTDDDIGLALEMVGYGQTSNDNPDEGTRRSTELAVVHCTTGPNDDAVPCDDEAADFLVAEDTVSNLCVGDSGGPAFHEVEGMRAQAGINSYVEPNCEGGVTGSLRVDRYRDWIDAEVDDVLWLSDLLPEDFDPEPEPEGCGCVTGGPSGWWALSAAALVLLRRRR